MAHIKIPANITRYHDRIAYVDRMQAEMAEGAQRIAQAARRAAIQPELDRLDAEAGAALKANDSARMTEIERQVDALLESVRVAS